MQSPTKQNATPSSIQTRRVMDPNNTFNIYRNSLKTSGPSLDRQAAVQAQISLQEHLVHQLQADKSHSKAQAQQMMFTTLRGPQFLTDGTPGVNAGDVKSRKAQQLRFHSNQQSYNTQPTGNVRPEAMT